MSVSDLAPADFLQLAGHKLRWRLLSELARSDRVVQELTALVGEPQNLVSYHLAKLRDGGLVSSRRSSADRRDAYYALDLPRFGALLGAAGAALHPGLQLAALPRATAIRKTRILFLCTGNSARSQMAEALAKHLSGGAIKAFSAGSEPKPLHANAIRVMREQFDLDLSKQKSKHLDALAAQHFDWVISLCDRVREICPEFPGAPNVIHWSIANPATGEPDTVTYPAFQHAASELATRLEFLLATLAEPAPKHKGGNRA